MRVTHVNLYHSHETHNRCGNLYGVNRRLTEDEKHAVYRLMSIFNSSIQLREYIASVYGVELTPYDFKALSKRLKRISNKRALENDGDQVNTGDRHLPTKSNKLAVAQQLTSRLCEALVALDEAEYACQVERLSSILREIRLSAPTLLTVPVATPAIEQSQSTQPNVATTPSTNTPKLPSTLPTIASKLPSILPTIASKLPSILPTNAPKSRLTLSTNAIKLAPSPPSSTSYLPSTPPINVPKPRPTLSANKTKRVSSPSSNTPKLSWNPITSKLAPAPPKRALPLKVIAPKPVPSTNPPKLPPVPIPIAPKPASAISQGYNAQTSINIQRMPNSDAHHCIQLLNVEQLCDYSQYDDDDEVALILY